MLTRVKYLHKRTNKYVQIFFTPSPSKKESSTHKKNIFQTNIYGRKYKLQFANLYAVRQLDQLTYELPSQVSQYCTCPCCPPGVCIIKHLYRRSSARPWLAHLARDSDEHCIHCIHCMHCINFIKNKYCIFFKEIYRKTEHFSYKSLLLTHVFHLVFRRRKQHFVIGKFLSFFQCTS